MTGQLIMQLFRKTFKMKQIFFILLFVCFVVKGQVVPLGFISSVVEQKEVYFDTYVTIGSQKWLDHDLAITTYNDGSAIYFAANKEAWVEANTNLIGAWCYKDFNPSTNIKLYNYYAVENTDNDGLIPYGWHLPTKNDYETLISFIGGYDQVLKLMSPNLEFF